MSKKVTFELNRKGVADLMKSQEMQTILNQLGNQKATQAGDGYKSDVHVYQKRAVAQIYPGDRESGLDNYENNTLLKIING